MALELVYSRDKHMDEKDDCGRVTWRKYATYVREHKYRDSDQP
jgi:hypothetical protein